MAHKKYLTKEDKLKALARNNSKYWKTKKGKLMLTYNNMKRRVDGYVKKHIYEGLDILDRDDFYEFSNNCKEFNILYDEWVKNDYDRKLSPSIDRIDTNKGYVIDNIQWITHSENSIKGLLSRYSVS